MHCIKCGQEIEPNQVFCPSCLADMEQYPVNPGTPVYIPTVSWSVRKQQRFPTTPAPEEQIRQLQKKLNLVTGCLIAALIALAVSCGVLLYIFQQPDRLPTGQDYNVTDTTSGTNTTNGRRVR